MTQNTIIAIGSWGIVLYLWWSMRRLDVTLKALQGITIHPASWLGRIVYLVVGVTLASAVFAGAALADGVSPFDHIQNILSKQIPEQPVMQPVKPRETVTPTPMMQATVTASPIPTPAAIVTQTIPTAIPTAIATPGDDDRTPGWMKTPNGNGQGQFQTPPGQGGIPPGQEKKTQEPKPPNEPKPTNEPKPNNGNTKK